MWCSGYGAYARRSRNPALRSSWIASTSASRNSNDASRPPFASAMVVPSLRAHGRRNHFLQLGDGDWRQEPEEEQEPEPEPAEAPRQNRHLDQRRPVDAPGERLVLVHQRGHDDD